MATWIGLTGAACKPTKQQHQGASPHIHTRGSWSTHSPDARSEYPRRALLEASRQQTGDLGSNNYSGPARSAQFVLSSNTHPTTQHIIKHQLHIWTTMPTTKALRHSCNTTAKERSTRHIDLRHRMHPHQPPPPRAASASTGPIASSGRP